MHTLYARDVAVITKKCRRSYKLHFTVMLDYAEIVTDMELFAKVELGITGGKSRNI